MLIGVIADDFTGGTDIGSFLVKAGLRTLQLNGVPTKHIDLQNYDAVIISLISRSCSVDRAVELSIQATLWLWEQNTTLYYFKYCSTFDSNFFGNIGPVTDALMDELNVEQTIVCPSLHVNGRTVFNGHLFVNGVILNESGMKDNPITPMTNSNRVTLMTEQSKGTVVLLSYQVIEKGLNAIIQKMNEFSQEGHRYVVTDAFTDAHLDSIAKYASQQVFVTGSSGLGLYIGKYFAYNSCTRFKIEQIKGGIVILSGSCSMATNEQVSNYRDIAPSLYLNIEKCLTFESCINEIYEWALSNQDHKSAPIIYATSSPETVVELTNSFPDLSIGRLVEQFFGKLHNAGISNFIVAGGETSGVITQSLGGQSLIIGQEIVPGIPWVTTIDNQLNLALKSGNFGSPNFFIDAQTALKEEI